MKIKTFTVNPFQMNSYIYYCEHTLEGVLIDPGYHSNHEKEMFLKYIHDNKINIKYILLTHGHVDHVLGNGFATKVLGVDSFIHKDDQFLYDNAKAQGEIYGIQFENLPVVNNFITEETIIKIGNNVLNFIHTPGHSPGGVCIIDDKEKVVFCGDVIFQLSIGRTDLPGGDYHTLLHSIKSKLFEACSDEYELYPGHMGKTTIGEEKKLNPFLQN
ncbi:MAG: MBL fold metallo-hydrolase [Candidatus Kapaibacterium sp.]